MRVLVAQTWFRAVPVKNFFLNSRSLVLMVIFVVEVPCMYIKSNDVFEYNT